MSPVKFVDLAAGVDGKSKSFRRCFAWTDADKTLSFKVRGDEVNIQKLAGGILLRCEQRLETNLESAGSKSVYNCVKALVLANLMAQRAQQERDSQVARIGFVPSFGRTGEMQWMRLGVVAVGSSLTAPKVAAAGEGEGRSQPQVVNLKVGARTDMVRLREAIIATWMKRCTGSTDDPQLSAMGRDSVSLAVKAAAFALRDLAQQRGGGRMFCCFPTMEQLPERDEQLGEKQTIVSLRLEFRPRSGDQTPPLAGSPAESRKRSR